MKKRLPNKQQKTTSQTGKISIITIGVITAIVFGVQVFAAARVATTGNDIRNLEIQRALLREEINTLKSDLATMSSLSEVEKRATVDLGMHKIVDGVVYLPVTPSSEFAAR